MSEKPCTPLTFYPDQLIFQDVKFNETYTHVVSIRNNLSATVDICLRAGSVDRYTITPNQIQIKPGELSNVEIKLKVVRYAHIKKAASQGQKDIFHIKSKFFDQKYYCTFFMSHNGVGCGSRAQELLSPQKLQQTNLNNVTSRRSKQSQATLLKITTESLKTQDKQTASYGEAKETEERINKEETVGNALRKEREEQELRNEKVLQLLQSKDHEISELTDENANLKKAIEELQQKLNSDTNDFQQESSIIVSRESCNKSIQTDSKSKHLVLQDQCDVTEELCHAKQYIKELQSLLDKQRETFALEYKRLLKFNADGTETKNGSMLTTEVCSEKAHEEIFEENLQALKEEGSPTVQLVEKDQEQKMLDEIAFRDARISELAAQTEHQQLEIDNLQSLKTQLEEMKQLNALAKQAAIKTKEELDAAQVSIKECKSERNESESKSQELQMLLQSAQSRLYQTEMLETNLKAALQSAKEEKSSLIVQGKKDRHHLESQIRQLQENLKTLRNPQPSGDEIKANSQKTTSDSIELDNKVRMQLHQIAIIHVFGFAIDASEHDGCNTTAKNESKQPMDRSIDKAVVCREENTMNLHRSLATAEQMSRMLRSENEGLKIQIDTLQQKLVDASKECSSVQSRFLELETNAMAKMESLTRQNIYCSNEQSNELNALQRHLRESEMTMENLNHDKGVLEGALADEKIISEKLKVELLNLKNSLQSQKDVALEKEHSMITEISQLQKQLDSSSVELESIKVKNTVLLETLETLQVGNLNEKEQRIVALNAQLLQLQTLQASTESRVIDVQKEYQIQSSEVCRLDDELGSLKKEKFRFEDELQLQENKLTTLETALEKLRSTVKDHSEENIRLCEKLDQLNSCLRQVEADRAAAREALELVGKQHLKAFDMERKQLLLKIKTLENEAFSKEYKERSEEKSVIAANVEEILATAKRICFKTRDATNVTENLQDEALLLLPVLERFKSVIVEAHKIESNCETDIRIAQSESEYWSQRVKILEDSLNKISIEWQMSESKTRALSAILNDQDHAHLLHSQQYIKRQAIQMETLWTENKNKSELVDELQCRINSDERLIKENERQLVELRKRVHELETENKELKSSIDHCGTLSSNSWEYLVQQQTNTETESDSAIKKYFETEIVKLMLNTDSKEKIIALSRQICALKLTENKLSVALERAQKQCDVLVLTCAKLNAAMLCHGAPNEKDDVESLKPMQSEREQISLNRDLAKKSQDMYQLQQQMELTLKQCEIDALRSKITGLETALQAAQESSTEAVQANANELGNHIKRQEESYSKRLEDFKQNELQLQKKIESMENDHATEIKNIKQVHERELEESLDQAIRGLPTHVQLEQAEIAAEALKDEVSRLEDELLAIREENLMLNDEMKKTKLRVLELEAKDETTAAAVISLEQTLQQIERNSQKINSSYRSGNQKQRKGLLPANKNEISFGTLSRQLTQAKLAEADAQRKIRVAARVEVELRQMLGERDARISELKESLATQTKTSGSLKRQLDVYTKRHGGSNIKHSPNSQTSTAQKCVNMYKSEPEKKDSSKEVARLKIELAKRQADVLYLEGELAEAKASHFDPSSEQKDAQTIEHLVEEKNCLRTKLYDLINEVKETARQIQYYKPALCLLQLESAANEVNTQQDAITALRSILENYKNLLNQLEKFESQTHCNNGGKINEVSVDNESVQSKGSNSTESSSVFTTERGHNQTKLKSKLHCILCTVESIDLVIKAQKKGKECYYRTLDIAFIGKAPSEVAWNDICRRISNFTSRIVQELSKLNSNLSSNLSASSSKASTSIQSSEINHFDDVSPLDQTSEPDQNQSDKEEQKIMQDKECQTDKSSLVSTEVKELVSALKSKSAKWKQKCKTLGTALLKLKSVMTARETLLKEKLASSEMKAQNTSKEYKVQIQRLKSQSLSSNLQEGQNKGEAMQIEEDQKNSDDKAELESLKTQLSEARFTNKELSAKMENQIKEVESHKEAHIKLGNICDDQTRIISSTLEAIDSYEKKLNAFALLIDSQILINQFMPRDRLFSLPNILTAVKELESQLSLLSKHQHLCIDIIHSRSDHRIRRWKNIVLALRFKSAVSEFKDRYISETKTLKEENSRLLQELDESRKELQKMISEQAAISQIEKQNAESSQMLIEKHISEIEDLKIRHCTEKEALWKEASKQIQEAKTNVEQCLKQKIEHEFVISEFTYSLIIVLFSLALEFAEKENTMREEYNDLDLKHKQTVETLEKFRKTKAREISVLENRLRSMFVQNQNSANQKRKNRHPPRQSESDETSEDGVVTSTHVSNEGTSSFIMLSLISVLVERVQFWKSLYEDVENTCTVEERLVTLGRELEFEQLEKQKLRDDLATRKRRETEHQDQIKTLRKEIKALKGASDNHSVIAAERVTLKGECDRLKEEVLVLKEDLRSTKIESNSRQRALLAAQNNSLTDTNSTNVVVLEAEKQARISAEAKLLSMKNTLTRKDNLITELRRKMEEVEDTIRVAVLEEVQDGQERLRTQINKLTQSVNRKDSKIQELTGKLETLEETKLSLEKEISEKQKQMNALKSELKIRAEKQSAQSNSRPVPNWLKTTSKHLMKLIEDLSSLVLRLYFNGVNKDRHIETTSSDTTAIASIVELSSDEIEDLLHPRMHVQASEVSTLEKSLELKFRSLSKAIDQRIHGEQVNEFHLEDNLVEKAAKSVLSLLRNEVDQNCNDEA
eukprot:g7749.t1